MSLFDSYRNLKTPAIPPFVNLPDDYDELRQTLRDLYFSHDSIATVAHECWVENGCPDDELISERHRCKVKDLHWWQAEMMLDVVLDTDFQTIWLAREAWKESLFDDLRERHNQR